MGIDPELIQTFKESLDILFDARIDNSGYFRSWEYDDIHNKVRETNDKIKRKLGEKRFKNIWPELYDLDALHGRELAELEDSVYRQGFKDALFLSGEIERAKNSQQNIFI